MELAEEAYPGPSLTQEGTWSEGGPREIELVGEVQARPSAVPMAEAVKAPVTSLAVDPRDDHVRGRRRRGASCRVPAGEDGFVDDTVVDPLPGRPRPWRSGRSSSPSTVSTTSAGRHTQPRSCSACSTRVADVGAARRALHLRDAQIDISRGLHRLAARIQPRDDRHRPADHAPSRPHPQRARGDQPGDAHRRHQRRGTRSCAHADAPSVDGIPGLRLRRGQPVRASRSWTGSRSSAPSTTSRRSRRPPVQVGDHRRKCRRRRDAPVHRLGARRRRERARLARDWPTSARRGSSSSRSTAWRCSRCGVTVSRAASDS